jgi:PIN domain nuclease of toxin-antitoxin system
VNLLLDTCTFLWLATDPQQLSAEASRQIADPANVRYLSTVSAWEIGVLVSLMRLALPQPPAAAIPSWRHQYGIESLPLEEPAACHVPNLPMIHRDPFDRMLICQAIIHGMAIVTPDHYIQQYPVPTVW